jgi:3-oxoadipate enol-lactonase
MPVPKLHTIDSGSNGNPALIFLHGFPFDQTMWESQAALCKPDFRVVTYDQRGHGKSEAGDGRYFFEFFIDDLIRLMDMLQIEKAILCGLSMGGYVALRATERHPERVRALVLCDTRSEADADAAKLNRAADLRLIQEKGVAPFAEAFLKKALSPSTHSEQPAVVDRVRRMILGNPREGVEGTLIALATRTDTTPSLARIQVPTLVLVGAEDAITPPAAAVALRDHMAQSSMAVIPKAGHLSNLENPVEFNRILLEFLRNLRE